MTKILGESDNQETHKVKTYTSPNLLKDNNLNLKGYY